MELLLKTFLYCAISIYGFQNASAQFPIKTKISAEGIFQTGNVERILGIARAETRATDSLIEAIANANFAYGEQNDVKAEHNAIGVFDLTFFPFSTFYPFIFGSGEFNRQRNIEYRWQAGAGGGIFLLKEKDNRLKITAAVILDETQYTEDVLKSERISVRIKGTHKVFSTPLILSHTSFYQPALRDSRNYRASTLITLDFPFSEIFSFRAAFEDTYENIVAPGRKPNDMRLTFGISARFE
ncbi:MAG TPA: DUF481 domain-containing protein [Patescibacteria group bacterium]|nr:DUF481 domain-containing protein [Patescibacteria group bacterium]